MTWLSAVSLIIISQKASHQAGVAQNQRYKSVKVDDTAY